MKKILALLFAFTMALTTLTGCLEENDLSSKASSASSVTDSVIDVESNSREEADDDFFIPELQEEDIYFELGEVVKTEKSMYEELVKKYEEENYSFAFKMTDGTVYYTSSDKKHKFHHITANGKMIAVLQTNGEVYIIDIDEKKFCKGEKDDYHSTENFDAYSKGLINGQYIESYQIIYNSEEYIAEFVTLEALNGNGVLFVFDNNGDIIAIISKNEAGNSLIQSLRFSDADTQNFEIPSGYSEITRDDMIESLKTVM